MQLRLASFLVVVLATGPRVASPQAPPEPAQTGTTAAPAESGSPAAPEQETTVHGTVPDVTGRWLSLGWVDLPNGRGITVPALWEITMKDGKPVMTHRFVSLPPALKEQLDKANADGTPWKPTSEDVAQLRSSWDSIPTEDQHVAKVSNDLSGKDEFDDSLKNEPRSKDAIFVVRQRQDFDRSAGAVVKQVTVYSLMAPEGRDYTGNFDSATIAAAPFPIPLSFKGTTRMYRIDEPAPRGFFARLSDAFAGCGRRKPPS